MYTHLHHSTAWIDISNILFCTADDLPRVDEACQIIVACDVMDETNDKKRRLNRME
jgi:hypothetical protein